MSELSRKALSELIRFQVVIALLLFLPAYSLRFWQAWVYWILFSSSLLLITLYFLKHDSRLIERRLQVGPGAETERSQVILQTISSLLLLLLFVIPGLDHRFRWSTVPAPVVLSADLVVVLGFLIIFRVFRENSYTSGVVTVEPGQQVIATGPYGLVRHPMYSGSLLIFLATPFALGSPWALVAAVPLCAVMIARLLDEERVLSAGLPGYDEYCRKVRSRLIPGLW